MDYSKFVTAVLNNDTAQINEWVPIITAVLIKFLKVRLNAAHHDAEDCTQTVLMLATQKIREERINNPDAFIYYLFTSAKHEYLKSLKRVKEDIYDETPDSYSIYGDQLTNLLEEERLSVLEKCLSLLKPDYLDYIRYWFEHPRDEATVVADNFGISVNNAWTKKHRILKTLKDCCEKKLSI